MMVFWLVKTEDRGKPGFERHPTGTGSIHPVEGRVWTLGETSVVTATSDIDAKLT